MRAKTLKDAEELRHKQAGPQAKPTENSRDEEDTEQVGRKATPIKNGGEEGRFARRAKAAKLRAKEKRAKHRVVKIEAELEAMGDTVATRMGGASKLPARPSTPEGMPDNWIRHSWNTWVDPDSNEIFYA
ncbi:hypothetical protein KC356_g8904 [Hortaea werneckii]|nr:hypothetical protein KC356_g8904 [Hortaea werneckii]